MPTTRLRRVHRRGRAAAASSSTRTRTRRSSSSCPATTSSWPRRPAPGSRWWRWAPTGPRWPTTGCRFYTAPIKALVSEKFFELCEVFGADHVGMLTGDASVNAGRPDHLLHRRGARQHRAARGVAGPTSGLVVMDEFHFYAEPDRGWAWQVPLLELPQAQFVLMSATLGDVSELAADLTRRNGRETVGDRRRRAAGAADLHLGADAARGDAGGAGHAPTRRRCTSCTSPRPPRWSTRPACSTPAASAAGSERAARSGWPGSGSAPASARRSRSCCGGASASTTPGCCRATGGWSSSSPRPAC